MTIRSSYPNPEPAPALPIFDRLLPAPPTALVTARIDAHSGAGDVVADLFGRGGWVARAALDRQRRAISLESNPLTRMLAEVVLRPPDVRHLDAAFQGMSASPRRESSLKVSLGDLYATRCPTCGRMLVAEDFIWGAGEPAPVPIARVYRCTVCRDQRGEMEIRQAPLDDDDLVRIGADVGADEVRAMLKARFPAVDGAPDLVDELLDLHTPRQLVGLAAIIDRIETDLRAAPVLAALRLAFLHSILPASRLAMSPGRTATLKIASGHVKLPGAEQWREKNPWIAFEESVRLVRGFVQRLDSGAYGPLQARLGEDLRSLGEGTATAIVGLSSPSGLRAIATGALAEGRGTPPPRIRLVLGQPPARLDLERLAATYHATSWVLGRDAASLLSIDALAGTSLRGPWSWQGAALGRALEAVAPAMARDGRAVQIVDGGAEAVAAAALGGVGAGYRLISALLGDPNGEGHGIVELLPPGARMPPGARTRANVMLEPMPGGAGDPDVVHGRRLFAAPERFESRPFSAAEAARTVTDVAVETLRARGEPARYERLLGEILVGLDRAGQLRRLAGDPTQDAATEAIQETPQTDPPSPGGAGPDAGPTAGPDAGPDAGHGGQRVRSGQAPVQVPGGGGTVDTGTATRIQATSPDPVERLLALIRDEMSRTSQTRLVELEPGRWWLADKADREAAAPALADRVEWAVFSLLSTAGPLSEAAFYDRISGMFVGHDLPDEALVQACLDSYRSNASTTDVLATTDDLLRRSKEHTELLGALADGGHRMGLRVWLSTQQISRRLGRGVLGDVLDERERHAYLGGISRSTAELEEVDCVWYIRGKLALLFEVEWTAMLGDPLLRKHARIAPDERIVRFLVIPPERTELVRYKLARSPLLRAAMAEGSWNILKSVHLRRFLAADSPDLADLEPLVGLDPAIERSSEQLPMFGG
jgi:hypothetical protein